MDDSSQQNSLLPKLILVLLIVLVITLLIPSTARSQYGTLVAVEPADLVLSPGETSNVYVQVEGAIEIYGIEIRMQYDPEVIQIQDADPNQTGVQVSAGDMFDEDQGFLVRNQADNQLGEILYAFTLLAPAPPLTGSGTLIQFEVLGIAQGRSDLELEVILASSDGVALPLEEQPGVVIVGTPPAEPSTPTHTSASPSQTASAETTSTSTPATPSPTRALTESPTPTAPPPEAATPSETPQITDGLLPTPEATQPQGSGPTSTPSTSTGEPLASPDPSDSGSGDSQGTAGNDTAVGAKNTTLWITGILVLGIGGIAGGIYLYRRK
jgi:hypothetical protein